MKLLCLLSLLAAVSCFGAAENLYRQGNVKFDDAPRSVPFSIVLPEGRGERVLISARIRQADVQPGKEGWENVRITCHFSDAAGKKIGGWLNLDAGSGSAPFRDLARLDRIPPGAVRLQGAIANFGRSGQAEFRDIVIRITSDERLPQKTISVPGGGTLTDLFSLRDAWSAASPTREKISLNGWWQFRPAEAGENGVPRNGWGYFVVPGSWTGSLGAQSLRITPEQRRNLRDRAWYRRELPVPAAWQNRRILLNTDLIQTEAELFIDGKKAGRQIYPGGEFDLTGLVEPGKKHELALLVIAASGKSSGIYMAPGRIIPENAQLDNKGLLGDIFLEARPLRTALSDVRIIPSVRNRRIDFDAGFATLPPGHYWLKAVIREKDREAAAFESELFLADGKPDFRHRFGGKWLNPKLWDTDTPENLYTATLTLHDADGNVLDHFLPEEFGFREFTIDGRDFRLNGKKIHLRAFTSGYIGRLFVADDERVGLVCRMARDAGYNFMVCYNYNYNPGRFSYYESLHRVSSRLGMLSSVTLPHFNAFGGKLHEPAAAAEYRRLSAYIIRRFQNIPGVVMYAMNHNAMGYIGDQNPQLIGQRRVPAPEEMQQMPVTYNRNQGKITEAIVRAIDPSRPVYHHQSGKLGKLYTLNCYLNWAPRQERSDWLETWEKQGDMPVFLVEWGLPHVASYSSYRGPDFIWSCNAVQCVWIDEYNAAILGESAYRPDQAKRDFAEFQALKLKNRAAVNFNALGGNSTVPFLEDVHRVRQYMMEDNLRNMRARGLSGFLPWDQGSFWDCVAAGQNRLRTLTPAMLKRPGIVAEQLLARGGALVDPVGKYELNRTGRALRDGFREELGWIAGPQRDYTERSHTLRPGETASKSLIFLNDTRHERRYSWQWQVEALAISRSGSVVVEPGGRAFIPVEFTVPADFSAAQIVLEATLPSGSDRFVFDILPVPAAIPVQNPVGLIDPESTAAPLLRQLGVPFRPVASPADLQSGNMLVLGRGALDHLPFDLAKHMPKISSVLILEQSAATLAELGIRNVEYGLREVFPLAIRAATLRDWRGAGTAIAGSYPGLDANDEPRFIWQGQPGVRVWRAGNRGSVASVLPEKPQIGDWTPLRHGGFALQYAPLMLLREAGRRFLFCQLDVSGRTAGEPEALNLLHDALARLNTPEPRHEPRQVYYAGGDEGADWLRKLKIPFRPWEPDAAPGAALLVLAPGAPLPAISPEKLRNGLNILALGLDGAALNRLLPGGFPTVPGRHLYEFPGALGEVPVFAGLSAADLAWRDRRAFDAFPASETGGITLRSRSSGRGNMIAFQLPPWSFNDGEFFNRPVIRRATFTVSRLLHNLGAAAQTDFAGKLRRNIAGNLPSIPVSPWVFRADPENRGRDAKWYLAAVAGDRSAWRKVRPGRHFQHQFSDLSGYNGFYWYRLEFDLTPSERERMSGTLHVGAVDDESWIWLNDRCLGEVTAATHPDDYWRAPRSYRLKPSDFKVGRNVLAIRGNDLRYTGGLTSVPYFAPDTAPSFYLDEPRIEDNPYRYYRW